MKTIPAELAVILEARLGIEPYFIVKINWAGTPLLYGLQEYLTAEGQVYAYVQSFDGFTSSVRYDGFGAQNTLTVTFLDVTGHFKEKFDTLNVFDRTAVQCTVYLGAVGTTQVVELFKGFVHDPCEWLESEKTLKLDIVERPIEKEIGYAPNFNDMASSTPYYLYLKDTLSGATWPQVFGTVKKMPVQLLAKIPTVTTSTDVDYHNTEDPYYFPVANPSMCPYPLDTTLSVRLLGSDQGSFELKATGEFVVYEEGIAFRVLPTDITDAFYTDIPVAVFDLNSPDQKYNRFIIDRDYWYANKPQCRNMHLRVSCVKGGAASYFWVNCTGQNERVLTTNAKTFKNTGGGAAPEYTIVKVTKTLENVTRIPAGTIISDATWGLRNIYVVDLKAETTVDRVYYRTPDGLKTMPTDLYTVFHTTGSDASRLFDPGHPPCTYIKFADYAFLADTQNEKVLAESITEEPVVDAHNSYDTDYKIISYLLDHNAGILSAEMLVENQISMNFALFELEDLQDICPEIAYQAARCIRFRDSLAEIVTLADDRESLFTFSDSNVLMGSVQLLTTSLSDVVTRHDLTIQTSNYESKPITKSIKVNVDKFGDNQNSIDFYAFSTVATAEEYFNFWKDRLSWPWCKVKFTGFLNAFAVDVLDTVTLDFGQVQFYDTTKGTVLTNVLQGAIQQNLWNGTGVVEEVFARPSEGQIDFLVRLPIKVGGIT